MSTYHNAYSILTDVRGALNEDDTALIQGTATYGKYSNDFLMKQINRAQRAIYAKLFIRIRSSFLTSTTITGSSSIFALPFDMGIIRRFEDDQSVKVYPINLDHKPIQSGSGSKNEYYRKGNNLIVTRSNVGDTYTLWYYRKPLELEQGKAPSDNTLATSAKAIADYYNGLLIESETAGEVYTIDDYSAARVVDLGSDTLSEDDYYGTVSNLPEPFHPFIFPLAAMMAKADHPVAPEKPDRRSFELWKNELNDAILAFGGRNLDVPEGDIWSDWGDDYDSQGGVFIPGHSGLVF